MADARTAVKAAVRLTGPIVAVRRDEVEPRGGNLLPVAWHEEASGAKGARGRPTDGPIATTDGDVAFKTFGPAPVLFAIGRSAGADVIALLTTALRAERHVYVLAEVEDAQGRIAEEIANVPGARALVRTATAVPLSAAVSVARAAGVLWLATSTEAPARWRLHLAKGQCEALFRVLNHIFWHQAVLEGWQGPHGLELKPVGGDPPFDAHPPAASAPISLSQGPAKLSPEAAWTVWHEPGGAAPVGTARKGLILLPPSGDNTTPLAAWVAHGADVAWSDLGLPPFAVGESGGTLLAGFGPRTLVLRLEPDQARVLAAIALEAARTAAWRLKRELPLSDVTGRVWLPGEKQPATAEDSVARDCGSVRAPNLRAFASVAPANRPGVPNVARAVHWSWTIEPPSLPSDARPDAIHAAWEALDRDAERRVAALRERFRAYDERQGRVRSAFAALAGALLGFESDRRTLGSEIEAVAKVVPSKAGPIEARETLAKLTDLEDRAERLVRDLEKTEAEEKARLERERVRREWEERRDAARKRIPIAHARLEELAGLKRAREKELADAGNLADKRERKAKSASLEADLEKYGKEIATLKRETNDLEELLEQTNPPGTPTPSAAPAGPASASKGTGGKGSVSGFIPQPTARRPESVPDEALPAIGRLLRAKTGRYLAIDLWEHLDQGEAEAQRLGAELVAAPVRVKEGK